MKYEGFVFPVVIIDADIACQHYPKSRLLAIKEWFFRRYRVAPALV